MIKIALIGATGRMGRAIASAALDERRAGEVKIVATIGSANSHEDLAAAIQKSDVAIDFSTPQSALRTGELCAAAGRALLIGVTGLSDAFLDAARGWAARAPILIAPNTSLAVAVLCGLVEDASRSLGDRMDIRIAEAHHRGKKDAPSGTAKALGAAVATGRGTSLKPEEYASIRAGDIVGDHSVIFAGVGEQLILEHRATNRAVFADGALHAAGWLASQKPGIFRMADLLQNSEFRVDTRGGRP